MPSGPGMPPGFGPAPTPVGETRTAKPPVWLLFLAAGLAIAAGVVALIFSNPIIAIVCWVIAGPVAISATALFVIRDTHARTGLYSAPGWVKPLHYIAIGLCLICILAPAWRIADWVGHL